jgi:hypothetical protein
VVGLWQVGPDEGVLILGGSHLVITLMLLGGAMSSIYDGRAEWRAKLHMDDSAVQRLGRSVIRAGVSLPLVLAYSLMPRAGSAAAIAAVLATLGFAALVRLRTWGVLALGAAGAVAMTTSGALRFDGVAVPLPAFAIGALLLAAAAPFARPMWRSLRGI